MRIFYKILLQLFSRAPLNGRFGRKEIHQDEQEEQVPFLPKSNSPLIDSSNSDDLHLKIFDCRESGTSAKIHSVSFSIQVCSELP